MSRPATNGSRFSLPFSASRQSSARSHQPGPRSLGRFRAYVRTRVLLGFTALMCLRGISIGQVASGLPNFSAYDSHEVDDYVCVGEH